jgi:hypothetical protein
METVGEVTVDLVNYPCSIVGTNWKMLSREPADDWKAESYDDSDWIIVNLPDSKWGCENCDRYYRKKFVWWRGDSVFLNVSSDDGAACWVNGEEIFNSLTESRPCGAGKRACISLAEACIDPLCKKGWDYSFDITAQLKLKDRNTVACQVHNIKTDSWFEVG